MDDLDHFKDGVIAFFRFVDALKIVMEPFPWEIALQEAALEFVFFERPGARVVMAVYGPILKIEAQHESRIGFGAGAKPWAMEAIFAILLKIHEGSQIKADLAFGQGVFLDESIHVLVIFEGIRRFFFFL